LKLEKSFNPIEGFDFELLNDPDFKEDSVREELILPIIKSIGYSTKKPYKIIRSKALNHPFVSVGSARKKITCIPDYLFEVNEKYAWVLEAKGPNENILSGKHVEQAYSYAIHSEIRVPLFSLCNGKELVLFHISREKPLLHFNMRLLPQYLSSLERLVSPKNVLTADFTLAKDFGLHLKRLGFHKFEHLIFPAVPISFIAQLDNNQFTTGSSTTTEDGDTYAVSLDFGIETLNQLKGKIPDKAIELLLHREAKTRKNLQFTDGNFLVNVDCRVGTELQENQDEIFLPFIVNRFL